MPGPVLHQFLRLLSEPARFVFFPILFFPKNTGKEERWRWGQVQTPLVNGFPGLGVNRNLVKFSTLLLEPQPHSPFLW